MINEKQSQPTRPAQISSDKLKTTKGQLGPSRNHVQPSETTLGHCTELV